ncbi:MAG: CDP-diacylglycerol--glycerol-3-phosphate 3-phosphatidyltransferase [Desulfovibrio sp.]|jgi:CDP-diacylglycerol--glycerol-3-phosphate 3-phosphatidyltransferase|nr:CDP-diacylglycerol--glycerol-3-phosphate 3-phosphatidyltransferase [Desulfovibrio sp.]
MQLNLPTRLTVSRIAIVPVIVVLLMFPGRWTCFAATLLFAAAGFTDLLDGKLARKTNQITSLGKFLDPLADKILVSSALIMLVQNAWVPGWIAVLIISRDILVTGLRAVAAQEGVVIAADRHGKFKTVLQIVAVAVLLLHYDLAGIPVHDLGMLILYFSLALTVFSGYNYFRTFCREREGKPASPMRDNELP